MFHFGDYQDNITIIDDANLVSDESLRSVFLFHSLLSPMLNVGLILPAQVV